MLSEAHFLSIFNILSKAQWHRQQTFLDSPVYGPTIYLLGNILILNMANEASIKCQTGINKVKHFCNSTYILFYLSQVHNLKWLIFYIQLRMYTNRPVGCDRPCNWDNVLKLLWFPWKTHQKKIYIIFLHWVASYLVRLHVLGVKFHLWLLCAELLTGLNGARLWLQ